MRGYLAWLLYLVVAPRGTGVWTTTRTPKPSIPTSSSTEALLSAHNQERAQAGLAALTLEPRLTAAAKGHSDFMAKVNQLAHLGIGDGDPWQRITGTGYHFGMAAENIAWNERDVAEVMTAWMNSPGHRANILGPYTQMGSGMTTGPSGTYWCVEFGAQGAV